MFRQIWLDIGLPESHVLTGDAKDNFWGESFSLQRLADRCRDGRYWTMWTK